VSASPVRDPTEAVKRSGRERAGTNVRHGRQRTFDVVLGVAVAAEPYSEACGSLEGKKVVRFSLECASGGFQCLGVPACGLEVLQYEVEGGPVCGLALEDGAVVSERTLGLAVRIPPYCGESVNPGVSHVVSRD
jgi:hypothetical protein